MCDDGKLLNRRDWDVPHRARTWHENKHGVQSEREAKQDLSGWKNREREREKWCGSDLKRGWWEIESRRELIRRARYWELIINKSSQGEQREEREIENSQTIDVMGANYKAEEFSVESVCIMHVGWHLAPHPLILLFRRLLKFSQTTLSNIMLWES